MSLSLARSCHSRALLQQLRLLLGNGSVRHFSESSSSSTHAFDRPLKRQQKDNAARAHLRWSSGNDHDDDTNNDAVVTYDYFRDEIAARLVDRLDDIHREEGFPLALDLGAGAGHIYRALCKEDAVQEGGGGIGGVRKLVQIDSSSEMLHRDQGDTVSSLVEGSHRCDTYRMVADEEDTFPFPDGTFDLVISSTSLHWVNNLPSVFAEVSRILKPDGCFMFAMVGGTSLPELRASMVLAEMERDGGVSPHVGPFVQLSDVGNLLQRAGFSLPTIDVDTIHVAFPNAAVLMEHLQRMGENNACIKRRTRTPLDVLLATACIYDSKFGLDDNNNNGGDVEASVQVLFAIGWTPHSSQQQPMQRGTATHKFGESMESP